jgi:Protein of unknown function (DUF2793)
MPNTSPRLDLPYIQPSQAQKHVTHNEAVQRLDALVQMVVLAMGAQTPPVAPNAGDMHALGATPVSDWAGQADMLALWDGTVWQFIAPQEGWRTFDRSSAQAQVFDGGDWRRELSNLNNLDGVGIGTTSDPVNRLAVASDASLFTHAGTDHRIKVNKAADADTASLLFQSGWSGHAEMGLAGDIAFCVKISADGSTWNEAMRMDPAAKMISLAPGTTVQARLSDTGLQLDVPLTGTAVQTDPYDTTLGRVTLTGAFGVGRNGASSPDEYDFATFATNPTGLYWYNNIGDSGPTAYGAVLAMNYGQTQQMRVAVGAGGGQMYFNSIDTGNVETPWNRVYHDKNLIGAVSQAAGIPTGAVIERGSNANGEYIRFADGTQICFHRLAGNSSTDTTWTFSAAFISAGKISVSATSSGTLDAVFGSARAPTLAAVDFNLWNTAGNRQTAVATLSAVGRWF